MQNGSSCAQTTFKYSLLFRNQTGSVASRSFVNCRNEGHNSEAVSKCKSKQNGQSLMTYLGTLYLGSRARLSHLDSRCLRHI